MRAEVVIITGASSGFGRLAALEAARRGYRVVALARRAERLAALARAIEATGGTVLTVAGDVTRAEDQERLIAAALERFGRIDALVNNAGVPLAGGFAQVSVADLRRQWETNVLAVIELTRRALPALMRTRGVVVNVGSLAGHFSFPGWGLYYPSKVAVRSISDALRRELAAYGVRVALLEPGPYRTEFAQQAGLPDPGSFGLDPTPVGRAIVDLIEHPRRLRMMPGWMWLPTTIGAALVAAAPVVVDWLMVQWTRRQQRLRTTAAADAPQQDAP
ncbi:SDR family NAD(P)-dependent oxidoreductase [Kallotenue papyrolyticum]|uniref:SDR family NAD(P)-dependent oxidoreductase n=1 Tax=Kallotenue papyrolyticum TaxID=1325125 RepID=UPI0004786339|nr:SDR family NAD(P)-dependent oxidoreductase [Kallotenue papyrolyticum]